MNRNTEMGWHWLHNDRTLRYGNDPRVLGTYDLRHVPGTPELRHSGLHWSERVNDALNYAQGSIICRVECWGETVHGDDKAASEYRQIRWWVDAERVLWAWLCDTAEEALRVAQVTDERSLSAISLRREWLDGRVVSDQEWAAAWAAAGDAARAGAGDAAWAGARAAARAGAGAGARAAARAAARAVAGAAQNDRLEAMIRAEAKRLNVAEWDR